MIVIVQAAAAMTRAAKLLLCGALLLCLAGAGASDSEAQGSSGHDGNADQKNTGLGWGRSYTATTEMETGVKTDGRGREGVKEGGRGGERV